MVGVTITSIFRL